MAIKHLCFAAIRSHTHTSRLLLLALAAGFRRPFIILEARANGSIPVEKRWLCACVFCVLEISICAIMSSPSDFQNEELREACVQGDLESVQSLLDQWQSHLLPSALTPKHLQSPLAGSIAAGKTEVVSYLLDHGAELSPLNITQAVARHSSTEMFQIFLDHGWDINSKTDMREPALKMVVTDDLMTQWFLAHGADPSAVGGTSFSILDVAAANSSPAILDLLIAHGAKIEDSDALHSAAGECEGIPGRVEMMAHLVADLRMDINAIERSGPPAGRGLGRGTPLHSAVYAGKRERIVFLLERGANREAKNTLGQTPLEFAVAQDLPESESVLSGGS